MSTKVFISWSGPLSQAIAKELHEWLPSVIQCLEPYFTPEDIRKGAGWLASITKELQESNIGIICLTPQNLDSTWIHFESGAISKQVGEARVCALLFGGLTPSSVKPPLGTLQSTQFEKEDFFRLLKTINEGCTDAGEKPLTEERLKTAFDRWWSVLEKKIQEILDEHECEQDSESVARDPNDVLDEILTLCRENNKALNQSGSTDNNPFWKALHVAAAVNTFSEEDREHAYELFGDLHTLMYSATRHKDREPTDNYDETDRIDEIPF